jgi:hypothetical protein
METKTVKLPQNLLTDEVNVCMLQLNSPFGEELQFGSSLENKFFFWKDDALTKRRDHILATLKKITSSYKEMGEHIDILVFSEYSYSLNNTTIQPIMEYCQQNKTIVISPGDISNKRRSGAYIIVPGEKEPDKYLQLKLTRALEEVEYLEEIPESEKICFRFEWNGQNQTSYFFQTFICHDFLDTPGMKLQTEIPGFIFVPMCSSRTEEFYGLAYYHLRSISNGSGSIGVFLCNAVENCEKNKNNQKTLACGKSQLIVPTRISLPILSERYESCMLSKLRISEVLHRITQINHKDVILKVVMSRIFTDGSIKSEMRTSINKNIIINPNAIMYCLGLKKYMHYLPLETL